MATAPITQYDQRAISMGDTMENDQTTLMQAYALTDGSDKAKLREVSDALGLTVKGDTNSKVVNSKGDEIPLTAKSLQLIAEQRFQQTSSRITLFSNLMERIAQMRQQLINNMKG